jgi:LuxR family transcriptional regulator, maltose regulon positive regulatory protein
MSTPLLSTKYHLPPAASQQMQRSRLHARMNELLLPGKRLALVSSLAGSGKTTLVRSWVEQFAGTDSVGRTVPIRVAWLSLDEEDNDLAIFLAYFLAAMKATCPEIDIEPGQGFEQGAPYAAPPVWSTLTRVVNQLSGLPGQIVLVFDDYHTISEKAIHELLTFLIEHLPESVRLVVITRAESLLPVSRLRARGQLVEIREADLRFTPAESLAFLDEIMGLRLNPAENELLVERTEGWAAGLQMAALALKALPDGPAQTGEFVQNFSGSHRFVLDYLMDEVFSHLPPQTQAFLLQIAILERFCLDLCKAVIGELANGGTTSETIEQQLSFLIHSQLFIIPLDEERCWFRFHRLFAELLQNRLRQNAVSGEIAERERRAGAWFAGQGLLLDAIHYMLQAKDFEQAADLITACAQEVISAGRLNLLEQWLTALPKSNFANRPRLSIFLALTSFLKGDSAAAINILEDTDLALKKLPESENTQALKRELISILAISNISGGNSQRVLALVQDALDTVPETEPIPHARLLFAQAMACAMTSDKRYPTLLKQALDLARKAGDVYLAANILNLQAIGAVFFQAQYRAAWQMYAEIIRLCTHSSGETPLLPTALGYFGQAEIALEWNDPDQASKLLDRGLEISRHAGQPSPTLTALLVRARLNQTRGDMQAAQADLEEAASKCASDENITAYTQLAQAQVRLFLATGQLELAEQCAAGADLPLAVHPGPGLPALIQEVWIILHARVLLAQEHPYEALGLLEPIIPQAKSAGRLARVVEGSLVQALALYTIQHDAFEPLHLSLSVSQPQGITRLYLEAGPGVRDLLAAYRPRLDTLSGEADRLLRLLNEPATPTPAALAEMIEPLTPREMDVLRLLCEGLSNQEIAAALFLSLSAVKKYTGNLYLKLGVTSRAQAIVKTHELHLL